MNVAERILWMEACSLCSPVAETVLMLSPLTPSRFLSERLAPRELAFLRKKKVVGAFRQNEIRRKNM